MKHLRRGKCMIYTFRLINKNDSPLIHKYTLTHNKSHHYVEKICPHIGVIYLLISIC